MCWAKSMNDDIIIVSKRERQREQLAMQRVRVTVRHNPDDPTDDLRRAARVRQDLWAHSPVEVNPGSPRHATHRDGDRNAYFEFATDHLPEVERVLREYGHID